ncbi:hypothetical protein CA831_24215, partial [Burkholderia multivorans]
RKTAAAPRRGAAARDGRRRRLGDVLSRTRASSIPIWSCPTPAACGRRRFCARRCVTVCLPDCASG